MANTVTLTYATGTITLQNAGVTDFTYTPIGGAPDEDYVIESAQYRIVGTGNVIRNTIGSIERAFSLARQYNAGEGGERVYLNLQPAGYTDSWRSEVTDGELHPRLGALDQGWTQNLHTFDVKLTRRNYFEGTLTEVPLTNLNGTNSTGGTITVFNNQDLTTVTTFKRVNHVDVAGTAISGDLPGYARWTMTFPDLASWGIDHLTIGESVWPSVKLGDSGTVRPNNTEYYEAVGAGLTSNNSSSGGSCVFNWAVPGTITPLNLLPNAYDMDLNNSWYALMARMGGSGAYKFVTDLYEGGTAPMMTQTASFNFTSGTLFGLYPLAWFQLPAVETADRAYRVYANVTVTSIAGTSFNLDFVQPIGADMWRRYEVTKTLDIAHTVVLDESDEQFYAYNAGATITVPMVAHGEKLALYPGKNTRFYFAAGANGTTNTTAGGGINPRLYYRPRRRTI